MEPGLVLPTRLDGTFYESIHECVGILDVGSVCWSGARVWMVRASKRLFVYEVDKKASLS